MAETRLDSWKEIAEYLHRDVSTVRRWEQREGLPVHLYTVMNRSEEAAHILSEFRTRGPQVSLVTSAALYAAVGERDRPLALLEKACNEHDPDVGFMKSVPAFDSRRDDPVFQSLLRRIGLS